MALFAMPIILMVEADSIEDAQKAIDDWSEEIDMGDDLPVGTEDINTSPECENNDEGQRLLYLPAHEEDDNEDMGDDNEDDDFNNPEEDF